MKVLKLVATVLSLAIAGLGVLGLVSPPTLIGLAGLLLARPAIYGVAAVRIVFGGMLFVLARDTRWPRMLRFIGAAMMIAGALTPLVGGEQLYGVFGWLWSRPPLLLRAIGVFPLAAGLWFAYALNARPRSAG
jgi:hypothetical protein